MSGSFVIQKASSRQYYFNLRARNNEIILTGETYLSRTMAQRGIQAIKVNALLDAHYVRKVSGDGQLYFVLLAANGEPLGKSELYPSVLAREAGIKAVKQNAPQATILYRTP